MSDASEKKESADPKPVKKGAPKWLPFAIAGGVLAFLAAGFVILVTAGVLTWFFFFNKSGTDVSALCGTAGVLDEEYYGWKSQMSAIGQGGALPDGDEAGGKAIGFWERFKNLPSNGSVEELMGDWLGDSYRVTDVEAVSYEGDKDGLSVTYRITIKPRADILLVPVVPAQASAGDAKMFQGWGQWLLLTNDLPAGWQYDSAGAAKVYEAGKEVSFLWKAEEFVKEDGKWVLRRATPMPMAQLGSLDARLVNDPAVKDKRLLRSSSQLARENSTREAAVRAHISRMTSIESEVAALREQLLAQVGPKPEKGSVKFGGSGSGEPTKSAARVAGGAASGAAIGAIADGGEGAGWGALAGAGAGLVYDVFSKSSDKKKLEDQQEAAYRRAKAAYSAAKDKANAQADARKKELVDAYKQELENAAAVREDDLMGGPGC